MNAIITTVFDSSLVFFLNDKLVKGNLEITAEIAPVAYVFTSTLYILNVSMFTQICIQALNQYLFISLTAICDNL